MGLGSFLTGAARGVRDFVGGLNDRPGEEEQRAGLTQQAQAAGDFAGLGESGFGRLGGELGGEYGFLRDIASGKNSIAGEQLRQGLQQQLAAQRSMAAGASPQNQSMAMLHASRNAMNMGSGLAGQQALAGMEERRQAQSALLQALLQQRQQELSAALGSRGNAIQGYGGITPGQSTLDSWAGPLMGAASIAASDRNLKTDVQHADGKVDAMLDAIAPMSYRYIDEKRFGAGPRVGIMAQDLQKTEAGRELVIETEHGLMVDLAATVPVLLATVARLNARVRELEQGK